jgi:hypothetical protein
LFKAAVELPGLVATSTLGKPDEAATVASSAFVLRSLNQYTTAAIIASPPVTLNAEMRPICLDFKAVDEDVADIEACEGELLSIAKRSKLRKCIPKH